MAGTPPRGSGSHGDAPSRRARLAAALAIGVAACAVAALFSAIMPPHWHTDFDAPWAGARALWTGRDPYALSHDALGNAYGLYYPVPALLAALPVAWLPLRAARAAFAGTTMALCAWTLTRDGWHRWPIFVSMAAYQTVVLVQWGPLLVAAALTPALAGILLAKPNLGLALGAGLLPLDRRRLPAAAASGAVLLALSFLAAPAWLPAWRAALVDTTHITAPVTRLGGPLLLLAALRWRRPEARLLLALAVVPQTPSVIEALPLALVCRSPRETLWLAVLSYVAYLAVGAVWSHDQGPAGLAEYFRLSGAAVALFTYLPALGMVLRRPNEAPGTASRGTASREVAPRARRDWRDVGEERLEPELLEDGARRTG